MWRCEHSTAKFNCEICAKWGETAKFDTIAIGGLIRLEFSFGNFDLGPAIFENLTLMLASNEQCRKQPAIFENFVRVCDWGMGGALWVGMQWLRSARPWFSIAWSSHDRDERTTKSQLQRQISFALQACALQGNRQ